MSSLLLAEQYDRKVRELNEVYAKLDRAESELRRKTELLEIVTSVLERERAVRRELEMQILLATEK